MARRPRQGSRRDLITRRDFLKATGATATFSVLAGDVVTKFAWAPSAAEAKALLAATPSLSASVLRREDMLALRFDLYNLVRDKGNLVRQNAAQPAYVVATLGYGADHAPQNVGEQAFLETDDSGTAGEPLADPGDVQARLAGPTRLAFRVPDATTSIPFTLQALLDLPQLEQSVVPAALPPLADPASVPEIREPEDTETRIETPWKLVLSPHAGSAWAHASSPVVRNGRTELWHTRLAVRKPSATDPTRFVADESDAALRAVRAVWMDGFDYDTPPAGADPFRMSLTPQDRWRLVHLSADFALPDDYLPRAIQVGSLMLSTLGAWQNTRGYFTEPPTGYNLGEWRHIATMGRDQYVRVVYLGWLLPFGHPAALIKVTERKLQPIPAGTARGAYLRQRFFIVVRQPRLTYPETAPQPSSGRQMPYKTVELKTLVTPTLGDPADPNWSFETFGDHAFIPVVEGAVLPFSIVGTDRDGQTSEFTLPLVFVSYPDNAVTPPFTEANIATVVADYAAGTGAPSFSAAMKTAALNGQKVGMARSTKNDGVSGGKPGDTAVETKTLTFSATDPDGAVPKGQAPFYPIWTEAEVRLNAVEAVQGGSLAKTVIQPHPTYVSSGYDGSEIFAKLKVPVDLSFTEPGLPAVDRSGGLVNPDMKIGGLSRKLGPVGGDVSAIPPKFDPSTFFNGAKILGGIPLKDIIDEVLGFAEGPKVPKLVSNVIYPNGDTAQPPEKMVTTFNFVPGLHADPLGIFDPTTDSATMTIDATFTAPILPPRAPTYEIVGDLRRFRVHLLGTPAPLIGLAFNQLKFTTKSGSKTNVDVDIREVTFEGVLSFVNTLKDYLKFGSTGPYIDLAPTSVTAGFNLPIPTVGVGVLTIQNIAFGAALTIPFTGKPARARFNFSERQDPFLVTVIGLGGGGFFAIALGLDGLEVLEASIEVGASVALNLGVASGEVHALAGIYYKLERKTPPATDEASLTAYVRLGGSVNVLGIASVSVEFYLGMKYQFDTNELWGQATLTVEVEVLMFSASFDLTVERRIAGPSSTSSLMAPFGVVATAGTAPRRASLAAQTTGGLSFTDLLSEDEWDQYTAAFAVA